MTETAETTVPKSKSGVADFLDSLSKAAIVILFAIYIFGFVIVSIHDSSYGLSEVNPLKPRIVSAGTLFLLLIVVPIVSGRRIFSYEEDLKPEQKLSRGIVAAYTYFIGCAVLASALIPLYVFTAATPHVHKHWWSYPLEILVLIAVLAISGWILDYSWKSYRGQPGKTALLTGVLLFGLLVWHAIDSRTDILTTVGLWFFAIGIVAAMVDHRSKKRVYNWEQLLLPIVSALAIFPAAIYPHIKSSWGGGSAVPVIVYFSPESRILPGQKIKAELLDESDNGIYVVQPGTSKALFIPRTAVSALYFSTDPLPVEFLGPLPK